MSKLFSVRQASRPRNLPPRSVTWRQRLLARRSRSNELWAHGHWMRRSLAAKCLPGRRKPLRKSRARRQARAVPFPIWPRPSGHPRHWRRGRARSLAAPLASGRPHRRSCDHQLQMLPTSSGAPPMESALPRRRLGAGCGIGARSAKRPSTIQARRRHPPNGPAQHLILVAAAAAAAPRRSTGLLHRPSRTPPAKRRASQRQRRPLRNQRLRPRGTRRRSEGTTTRRLLSSWDTTRLRPTQIGMQHRPAHG